MDPDLKKDILDVRNVIERSTSKVSLRDLEKKGFRKVKVLRAGDINELIYKAVQNVLAKQPAGMSAEERERIVAEAKAEYEKQTKQLQELQEQQAKVEEEKGDIEAKSAQIEAAHKNLETKLAAVNAQLSAERGKMLEERKQLEREKQSLFEKGMDAVKGSQAQVSDLQAKLADAQARLGSAVSQQQYAQLQKRAGELEAVLENARADAQRANIEVERWQAEAQRLQADVDRARTEGHSDASQEVQVLRDQLEQNQAQQQAMFTNLMGAIQEMPKTPAAASPDFEKVMKSLQNNLTDQLRKYAGSGWKGGYEGEGTADLGALMARNADATPLETNISSVTVKEQSAQGVRDKLSKLRNLRGGGGAPK